MKLRIAHEELWVLVIDGSHDDGKIVEMPDDLAQRCKKAQEEWEACKEILFDAYSHSKALMDREKRQLRNEPIVEPPIVGPYVD